MCLYNSVKTKLILNYDCWQPGIAAIVIHLQNMADIWETRVKAAVLGTMSIPESDWRQFYLGLEEWVVALEEAQLYVGSAQSEADRKDEKPHIR